MKRFAFLLCATMVLQTVVVEPVSALSKDAKPVDWERYVLQELSRDGSHASYAVRYESGSFDLRLVDTKLGRSVSVGDRPDGLFSPNGKWYANRLASGDVRLTDVMTSRTKTYACGTEFSFSPSSNRLVLVSGVMNVAEGCRNQMSIVDLSTLHATNITSISEHRFNPSGSNIAYFSEDGVEQSANILDIESLGPPVRVARTRGELQALTWSSDGSAIAFLEIGCNSQLCEKKRVVRLHSVSADASGTKHQYSVRLADIPTKETDTVSNLRVTKNGNVVLFEVGSVSSTAPTEKPAGPELVQVWHSRDNLVVSDQRRENRLPRLAAWNFSNGSLFELSKSSERFSTFNGDETRLMTFNLSGEGGGTAASVTLFSTDLSNGQTDVVATGLRPEAVDDLAPSPNGRFIAYYLDDNWWVYDFYSSISTNSSRDINAGVRDTNSDRYPYAPSYGRPVWATKNNFLVVYDQYDLWLVSTTGTQPVRITKGREKGKVYRLHIETNQPLMPGSRPTGAQQHGSSVFDPDARTLLTIFGEKTKKSGFAIYDGTNGVRDVVYDDIYVSSIHATSDLLSYVYQEERFDRPARINWINLLSGERRVLARSNSRFDENKWGRSRLISYQTDRGETLQGLLFYPAEYRKGKKYPLIVSIYERQSDALHKFRLPITSEYLSVSSFTNDGYFVLLPDIRYAGNSPGLDAVACVTSAVTEVLTFGDIRPGSIGLTGASWGGYQTLFVITQTRMFAAAVAGSAPTDLVSLNLSVEPGSGRPTMWRFEQDQMRIRTPLHEDSTEFLRGSPVLNVAEIQTPLLSWFGGRDPQIDPSQAVEMYNALRRANKPHVLLIYPAEGHVFRASEAVSDLDDKIRHWFDHYLKEAPATDWMEHGEAPEYQTN